MNDALVLWITPLRIRLSEAELFGVQALDSRRDLASSSSRFKSQERDSLWNCCVALGFFATVKYVSFVSSPLAQYVLFLRCCPCKKWLGQTASFIPSFHLHLHPSPFTTIQSSNHFSRKVPWRKRSQTATSTAERTPATGPTQTMSIV